MPMIDATSVVAASEIIGGQTGATGTAGSSSAPITTAATESVSSDASKATKMKPLIYTQGSSLVLAADAIVFQSPFDVEYRSAQCGMPSLKGGEDELILCSGKNKIRFEGQVVHTTGNCSNGLPSVESSSDSILTLCCPGKIVVLQP